MPRYGILSKGCSILSSRFLSLWQLSIWVVIVTGAFETCLHTWYIICHSLSLVETFPWDGISIFCRFLSDTSKIWILTGGCMYIVIKNGEKVHAMSTYFHSQHVKHQISFSCSKDFICWTSYCHFLQFSKMGKFQKMVQPQDLYTYCMIDFLDVVIFGQVQIPNCQDFSSSISANK